MSTRSGIHARFKALSEAALFLNSTLDLSGILSKNLRFIIDTLGVDRGTFYLMDDERGEIWSRILTGDEMTEIRLPYGKGLAGTVAQTGETILLEDAYQDPRFNPDHDKRTGYRSRSMLVLPVRNNQGKQVAVLQLINKRNGPFTKDDAAFAGLLGSISAVAIANAMLHEENLRVASLRKELTIARDIQQQLLPRHLPSIPGYTLLFHYQACNEVGGDYLQIFPLESGSFLLVIADVSGHGIPAALLVSTLHAAIESRLHDLGNLALLAYRLNHQIHRNAASGMYITFFAAMLNPVTNELKWVNAGHPSPVHVKHQVADCRFPASGPPLGLMRGIQYEEHSLNLQSGEQVALFTDGITENFDDNDDLFGEDRLGAYLIGSSHLSPTNVVTGLFKEIDRFTGDKPADDDRAILILKRS